MAHLKPDNQKERHRSDCAGPVGIDSMMREVLHKLGDIDVAYEIELDRLEHSSSSQALKSHIKRRIMATHHERRESYVALLTALRQRQLRLSFSQ